MRVQNLDISTMIAIIMLSKTIYKGHLTTMVGQRMGLTALVEGRFLRGYQMDLQRRTRESI
jgi:hypothetical protein